MTDIFDRASEQEDRDRAIALQTQRSRASLAGKAVADSAIDCKECEAPIPHLRREAMPGCQFCVECQSQREKAFYER